MDITNCYAIPFDEDPVEKNVWFIDTNYHETMFEMFKKIHSKEKVWGWYTTGNKFKSHDIEINELFRKYTPEPIMVMIDVKHLVNQVFILGYFSLTNSSLWLCR